MVTVLRIEEHAVHLGETAENKLAKLRTWIDLGRVTGTKEAHSVIQRAAFAYFETIHYHPGGQHIRFLVVSGHDRTGTPKRWKVTARRLSDRTAKRTGKHSRLEAEPYPA